MSDKTALTICLLDLPVKDAAVFRRVIDFSARKGREYQLLEDASKAQLVIMNDEPQQCAKAKQLGATYYWLLVGNSHSNTSDDTAHIYSIKRPLLVTRVMRELDSIADAIASLEQKPVVSKAAEVAQQSMAEKSGFKAGVEAHQDKIGAVSKPELKAKPQHEVQPASQTRTTQADIKANLAPASAAKPNDVVRTNSTAAQSGFKTRPLAATPSAALSSTSTSTSKQTTATDAAETEIKHRYNALVVDDSFAIRKQLELELRDAHIGADFAEDGEICLEKTAQHHYDLIFLDIMMPGIDGYEVCRRLRTQEAWKKTPIIMLSGKNSPLDEVQGVLAGCSTYLTKPVKSPEFQKVLKRVTQWIDHFSESTDNRMGQHKPRSGQTMSYS